MAAPSVSRISGAVNFTPPLSCLEGIERGAEHGTGARVAGSQWRPLSASVGALVTSELPTVGMLVAGAATPQRLPAASRRQWRYGDQIGRRKIGVVGSF